MAKHPIEHLPVVKAYVEYFMRRAKKDLKIKRAAYSDASVEYSTRGKVYVWFFLTNGGVETITYNADGVRQP